MGMAASQARYLALTARKTNTEWEGQQINQARTALANQSANLFNQLLGMEVPNPPKETDYTEIQYSYSDGSNNSVIEKWDQISNNNTDYNYVVKHYYMANIFAGAKKQLQDPQIQLGDVLKKLEYDTATTTVEQVGNGIKVTYKINENLYNQKYDKITKEQVDTDDKLKAAVTSFETAIGLARSDGTLNTDDVYGYQDTDGVWHFFVAKETTDTTDAIKLENQLRTYETENDLLNPDGSLNFDYVYGIKDDNGDWTFDNIKGYDKITREAVAADENLKNQLTEYERENDLLNPDGSLSFSNIYGEKTGDDWSFKNTIGYHKIVESDTIPYMKALDDIDYSTVSNEPAYVGNSKLTELNKLIVDKDNHIDQVSELAQILRDCPTDSVNKYLSFDDDGNLVYEGKGIYTFDLNGTTYYTTRVDLEDCINSTTSALNDIDNHYNAAYISKKIEETNNALLETDGKGRFTSVKFDNDSLVYQLNFEEVTNEAAYEDAMNEYMYKKAQYEKTIADINAKTSIIQKEDRTLELRMKQLDTEQNALATEMDAVKKVIKDNVEKTFKTFSD